MDEVKKKIYIINIMVVGSRAQVWHGTADKTSGGLVKKDLFMSNGRLRSKEASKAAKRNQNLKKAGWTHQKGVFGAVRVEEVKVQKKKKKGKKRRGSKKGSKRRGSRRR